MTPKFLWFSPKDIVDESNRICKKQRKYGKHSKALINWRLPESVLVGIVEVKREKINSFTESIQCLFQRYVSC